MNRVLEHFEYLLCLPALSLLGAAAVAAVAVAVAVAVAAAAVAVVVVANGGTGGGGGGVHRRRFHVVLMKICFNPFVPGCKNKIRASACASACCHLH